MRRKKARLPTLTPHDWPPAGTLARVDKLNGKEWDGPTVRIRESWIERDGRREQVLMRSVIEDPHEWLLPTGTPFHCYARDCTWPEGKPEGD